MLRLENISKIYFTQDEEITALKNINLNLDSTGFISIVGPSGCGKTTLLNMIGGLDQPTHGKFLIDDKSTVDFTTGDWDTYRNQMIGFVFQNYYLIPHLNILSNVELSLSIAGLPVQERRIKSIEILTTVGLRDKLYKKPNQLSGGQQQRVAIARALVNHPKVILADEPTGSLDHASSMDVMNLLKEISKTRLVIMVTHNIKLATEFSDRIVEIEDGLLRNDQLLNPIVAHEEKEHFAAQASKMTFFTAFKLSFFNLLKRRFRTILTALAASIGVIGMTLVLAVAFGFNRYIEDRKTDTLNAFPIKVDRISFVIPMFNDSYRPNLELFPESEIAYPRNIQYEFQTFNTLTESYYNYVLGMDPSLYRHINFNYKIESNFIVNNNGTLFNPNSAIKESEVDQSYVDTNYNVLKGRTFHDDAYEVIIILDRYNRLSKDTAQSLGFSGDEPISFDELMNLEIKWVPNDVMYSNDGTSYSSNALSDGFNSDDAILIEVVGIIRITDEPMLDYLRSGIFYNSYLTNHILSDSESSEIVTAQLSSSNDVISGESLSSTAKETALRSLGYSTYPLAYTIYSSNFDNKDSIMAYLRAYNETVSINDAIEPLDIAGTGLATMRAAIDSTTVILIVFSGISLLISNIMIGIMTYTSVIERTKEIGILRSLGARKKDVGNIFYSETLMIGFISGVVGIGLTYLFIPLLNIALESVTTIPNISYLYFPFALLIIIINTLLTSISGIIPAQIASGKDPIVCLRNE